MSTDQILKEAMALSPEERADLVDKLLATLDVTSTEQAEIDRAWGEEADRRMEAYRRGEVSAEPVEDVIASLRKRRG
jgi:putative addiction module component (TIGR02574 family)